MSLPLESSRPKATGMNMGSFSGCPGVGGTSWLWKPNKKHFIYDIMSQYAERKNSWIKFLVYTWTSKSKYEPRHCRTKKPSQPGFQLENTCNFCSNQRHTHQIEKMGDLKKRKLITYHMRKLAKSASFASLMAAKKSSQLTACPSCLLKYRSMPWNVKKKSLPSPWRHSFLTCKTTNHSFSLNLCLLFWILGSPIMSCTSWQLQLPDSKIQKYTSDEFTIIVIHRKRRKESTCYKDSNLFIHL